MAKRTKLMIAAGGVAGFVLVLALGAVGGFVAANALSDDDEIEPTEVGANVEPDDESDSLTEALEFLVDEAVEADRLTEEQGERLKERLQSTDPTLVVPGLRKLPFGARGLPFFSGELVDLDTAASYLGLTESELRDELEDGNSLADVALDRNRSVEGLVDALAEEAEERIDEAVADGQLLESTADRLKDDLEDRVRERVEGELRWPGKPFDFGFVFPPASERPRALS